MCVNDAVFGSDSIEDAISAAEQLSDLLMAGGFPLRKWRANDSILLAHIPNEWPYANTKTIFDDQKKLVSANSSLRRLNPIFDAESQCIRVGGRLRYANLSFDQRFSFIIHPKSIIASLIINEYHLKCLHGGVQLTLANVREKFWIINDRRSVRKIISSCVPCTRHRGKP